MHAKKSVGIGGHISTLDEASESAYEQGMRREIEEELIINTRYESSLAGLINDDENEVGKVHLGVVHIFDVQTPDVDAREDEMVDAGIFGRSPKSCERLATMKPGRRSACGHFLARFLPSKFSNVTAGLIRVRFFFFFCLRDGSYPPFFCLRTESIQPG